MRGFIHHKPLWLVRPLGLEQVRKYAENMEYETARFYRRAAQVAQDASIRELLDELAEAELAGAGGLAGGLAAADDGAGPPNPCDLCPPAAVGEADGARLEVGLAVDEQGRSRGQVRVGRVDADPVTGDIGRQRGVDRHLERAGVWLLAHLDVEVVTGRGQGQVLPRPLVVDRDSVGVGVMRVTVAGATAGQARGVGGRDRSAERSAHAIAR